MKSVTPYTSKCLSGELNLCIAVLRHRALDVWLWLVGAEAICDLVADPLHTDIAYFAEYWPAIMVVTTSVTSVSCRWISYRFQILNEISAGTNRIAATSSVIMLPTASFAYPVAPREFVLLVLR